MIIAIDGPAGSGKSTTARAVADRLGFRYLDTGAMYRAAALAFKNAGISPASDSASSLVETMRIDVRYSGGKTSVRLDGADVTDLIRRPDVSSIVSEVARIPAVRERLVSEQRRMAREFIAGGEGVVLDGRDIGTHVFPDADVKVFVVAEDNVRAARRMSELRSQGVGSTYEEVLSEIRHRDRLDSTRTLAPLRRAEDAVEIDTTDLSIDRQVEIVEQIARERSRSDSV